MLRNLRPACAVRTFGTAVSSSFHPRFKHVVAIGERQGKSRCCFTVCPDSLGSHLLLTGQEILTDDMLVQQLFEACTGMENCISCWRANASEDVLEDILHDFDLDKPTTLVVTLSPSGKRLSRSMSSNLPDASDIWMGTI